MTTKSTPRRRSRTGGKRGAPKGNKNAFKHGLYAKGYKPLSSIDRERLPLLESMPEIYMLQAQLDDILTLLQHCENETQRFKLCHSLFTGTQRLTAAMRTHTTITGRDNELLMTYWEALDRFWQEGIL